MDFSNIDEGTSNKNILLGDYAGSKVCIESPLNGDDCAARGDFKQIACKKTPSYKSGVFSELDKSFQLVVVFFG